MAIGAFSTPYDEEIEFVQNNICKRVCTTFVCKDKRCHCGYERKDHDWEARQNGGNNETIEWNILQHTIAKQTDAFGEIEFSGFRQNPSKYVRVDYNTDIAKIIDLMTNIWHLQLPKILISVTGGGMNYQMEPQLAEVFVRRLVKLAKSIGAWVTTGGLSTGIIKKIGKAIRQYRCTPSRQNKVVAIGIAPWGCVLNRHALTEESKHSSKGMWPAHYKINQEDNYTLDPNHSHFILVDDGRQNIFGTEIEFRAALEKEIANKKISDDTNVRIPLVVVIVGGDLNALKTLYHSVSNNNPVIIVKGSGGAADIMVHAYQNADEERYISNNLQIRLREMITELFGEVGVTEMNQMVKYISSSMENSRLITIFDMDSEYSTRDIDVTILKAHLKTNGGNEIDNVRLTLEWNRIDLAKSEIFTDETQWPAGSLDELMFSALRLDRVEFVELFLENGVILESLLTEVHLKKLYEMIKNQSKIKKLIMKIDDIMDNDSSRYSGDEQLCKSPIKELFFWALLLNRKEMTFLFWQHLMNPIATALVANQLLKEMDKIFTDYDGRDEFQAHAKVFEERALRVLNECFASDESMALKLLVHERSDWGKTSCILMAIDADNKRFISHPACQSLLDDIWRGQLDKSNNMWKLPIFIICPFLICSLITFEKKYVIKDQIQDGNKPKIRQLTWKQKVSAFYSAPVNVYGANVISYFSFLALCSYVLLIELNGPISKLEDVLQVWVFTIFMEEVRQISIQNSTSIRGKWIKYCQEIWNRIDIVNVVIFFIVFILRYTGYLEYARAVLSLTIITFCVRILRIFSIHKKLGPKLIMIRAMVKDLAHFMVILVVFMIAYGIASHAILYPKSELSIELLKHIIRKPYFQMYGELFLSEIEGEECNHNQTCPTKLGTQIAPMLMGVYILLTNVLLLNLLIAMFSNTFQEIQSNSDLHWHFQRFGLISEYCLRPVLPPPLILVNHIYLIIRYICNRISTRRKNKDYVFKKKLRYSEAKLLMDWEIEMTATYLMNEEKLKKGSMERKVFSTSDRTKDMMVTIEHQQQTVKQLETRIEDMKIDNLIVKHDLRCIRNQIKEVKELLQMLKAFK